MGAATISMGLPLGVKDWHELPPPQLPMGAGPHTSAGGCGSPLIFGMVMISVGTHCCHPSLLMGGIMAPMWSCSNASIPGDLGDVSGLLDSSCPEAVSHRTMSKKLSTAVICGLLAGQDIIFGDTHTINQIYGLEPSMFHGHIPHLTHNECKSIQTMMSSLIATTNIKAKYKILEGKETGWGAAQAALHVWFTKQKVSSSLNKRIDEVWERLGVLPLQLIQESGEDTFPDISDANSARDDIILVVFGDNALAKTVRGDFRLASATIMHHSWERHRKLYLRARGRIGRKRITAQSYCKIIEDAIDGVTADMLRDVTNAVKAYRNDIAWFPSEEHKDDGLAEFEGFLKEVVITVVAKAKRIPKEKLTEDAESMDTPAKMRGASRARKLKNISLAAAGDVDEIWTLYTQLFTVDSTPTHALQINLNDEEDLCQNHMWDDSDDLGVDLFRSMDENTLNYLLQFPDGCPALFSGFRSKSGKSAWDPMLAMAFVKNNPDMQPLSLLWHQTVGIASIVNKIWLCKENTDMLPGILIADEVGVGKTALSMGTIAVMMDAYWAQEFTAGRVKPGVAPAVVDPSKVCRAPILGKSSYVCNGSNIHMSPIEDRPFFAGRQSIPDLPHVIVVPNSLTAQWYSELRIFFARKSIEIYHYPTAEKEFSLFWTGHWAESKMPMIHRIILVPHSVMATMGKSFDMRKGKAGRNNGKASDDTRFIRNIPLHKSCLWFEHDFLTVIIDEGHEFRNLTRNFYAMLEVCKHSLVKLILTATPLYTSPKDLCNIGRLLRIPSLIGEDGDKHENDHWKALQAARRMITKEDKDMAASHTVASLAGTSTNYEEPESRRRTREVTMDWINKIKGCYQGRVIRRTVNSKRYDGKIINDSLPPYNMVIVPIHYSDNEQTIISEVMAQITGGSALDVLDDGAAFNTKFYLDGRTKVAFPFHTSPKYPPITTHAEWDHVRSSKVDGLIELLLWHLRSDDHGVFQDLDKEVKSDAEHEMEDDPGVDHADHEDTSAIMTLGTRKILVYMEFPMMAPLLVSILKLHNIQPLTLNGSNTVDERNNVIHKFNNDCSARVLLFSSVGAVGLNLTVASVVILFLDISQDQCWSRMLVNQIIGRAWRIGQQNEVIVYNMIGVGTVDVLMVEHGEDKGKMLAGFLSQNKGITTKLLQASRGELVVNEDSNIDIEEVDPPLRQTVSASSPPAASSSMPADIAGPSRYAASTKIKKTKLAPAKPAKMFGGKHVAQNISLTRDTDGDIIDDATIDLCSTDEDKNSDHHVKNKGKSQLKATVKDTIQGTDKDNMRQQVEENKSENRKDHAEMSNNLTARPNIPPLVSPTLLNAGLTIRNQHELPIAFTEDTEFNTAKANYRLNIEEQADVECIVTEWEGFMPDERDNNSKSTSSSSAMECDDVHDVLVTPSQQSSSRGSDTCPLSEPMDHSSIQTKRRLSVLSDGWTTPPQGTVRGHHGQWNDRRKCTVRLWNHGWGVEDVWSSSWTVESWRQWRRILEEYMRTSSKADTSYGMYSYVMHTLLSTIQDLFAIDADLLLRTKVQGSHNDFTVDNGSKAVVLKSTSKNGVNLCMMLFQTVSIFKHSDDTFYFDRPLQPYVEIGKTLKAINSGARKSQLLNGVKTAQLSICFAFVSLPSIQRFSMDESCPYYCSDSMSLTHATILIWWTTGKVLINIDVSTAVSCHVPKLLLQYSCTDGPLS
ncbi:hypothetical protein M405DRAFT_846837 [Rhizopogon salebrosus TDB-379]|nr:hypothetical protein M405DRAFT_846837 [Rhizopogon salebrosus TDB-379]